MKEMSSSAGSGPGCPELRGNVFPKLREQGEESSRGKRKDFSRFCVKSVHLLFLTCFVAVLDPTPFPGMDKFWGSCLST